MGWYADHKYIYKYTFLTCLLECMSFDWIDFYGCVPTYWKKKPFLVAPKKLFIWPDPYTSTPHLIYFVSLQIEWRSKHGGFILWNSQQCSVSLPLASHNCGLYVRVCAENTSWISKHTLLAKLKIGEAGKKKKKKTLLHYSGLDSESLLFVRCRRAGCHTDRSCRGKKQPPRF